jgi:tRNA nucleotidyltransferase (CCA-adding enzyme)
VAGIFLHKLPIIDNSGSVKVIMPKTPHLVTAEAIMSSPVRTIYPDSTIAQAQSLLLRYGHSGLSVVDDRGQLVGIISRRDLDLAQHHGFGDDPVRDYMVTAVRTIAPQTPLSEIQELMLKWDIGRLPVLENHKLVGIVTRTDVLRHLERSPQTKLGTKSLSGFESSVQVRDRLQRQMQKLLSPRYRDILQQAAALADRMNLQLYLVGGTVRDYLLNLSTDDLDLVVDGNHPLVEDGLEPEGWGIKLARSLQDIYPKAKLEIHGKFQTAALTWADGVWIDIATARAEFYPYAGALPEVAASSIQQDLYRRDFTINALALRLNGDRAGEILDFFGGIEDLENRTIRVLHPNSLIEDPTRIIRAVRFAVRLGFDLDRRTREYARFASDRVQRYQLQDVWTFQNNRLKQEWRYILTTKNWVQALYALNDLGALQYLHPDLTISTERIQALRRVGAWLCHFSRIYPEIDRDLIWQVRLEMLIAPHAQAVEVAERLRLNQAGLQRLVSFYPRCDRLLTLFTEVLLPSQVVNQLEGLSITEAIALAAIAPSIARKQLYRYLKEWNLIKMPLGGNELKQMGYPPGRQYQVMLHALKAKVLEREVTTLAEAKDFIRQQFPF